jgi:hypothetical protein
MKSAMAAYDKEVSASPGTSRIDSGKFYRAQWSGEIKRRRHYTPGFAEQLGIPRGRRRRVLVCPKWVNRALRAESHPEVVDRER